MKVTITRAKMLATLKASQKADLKTQQARLAELKKKHDERVKSAIDAHQKALASLQNKGWGDSVERVYAFDPKEPRDEYGYRGRNGDLKIGETMYDAGIAFVEACEDDSFVIDVDKDRTGLSQVFFAALKR